MDNKKLWPEKSYPRESCTNNHNGDKPSAPPSTLIKSHGTGDEAKEVVLICKQ